MAGRHGAVQCQDRASPSLGSSPNCHRPAIAIAGASWGTLRRPDALLRAAKRLQAAGCTAIAVVARFPDKDDEMLAAYVLGSGVDAIGGAEAIISHLITKELGIPCAHAPAVRVSGLQDNVVRSRAASPALHPMPLDGACASACRAEQPAAAHAAVAQLPFPFLFLPQAPRVCAEELGHTFLPCILVNLSRAPRLLGTAPAPGGPWGPKSRVPCVCGENVAPVPGYDLACSRGAACVARDCSSRPSPS